MGEKHETLDHIREYLESKEFEYKFKTWTTKTCKEVMAGYWKPMAAISSVFATIIGFMLAFIFGHFNHTIDKLQDTTSSLTQSVVRLEQTVEILYNEQNKQNTPHKLKSIGSI